MKNPTIAEKQDALRILVDNSIVLDEAKKQELLGKMNSFTEEEVDTLGRFLALEQTEIDDYVEKMPTKFNKALEKAAEIDKLVTDQR